MKENFDQNLWTLVIMVYFPHIFFHSWFLFRRHIHQQKTLLMEGNDGRTLLLNAGFFFDSRHVYVTNTFFCSFAKLLFGLEAATLGSLSRLALLFACRRQLLQNYWSSKPPHGLKGAASKISVATERVQTHLPGLAGPSSLLTQRITLCQTGINCSTVTTWTNSQAVLLAE